jgi:hypothetical protein
MRRVLCRQEDMVAAKLATKALATIMDKRVGTAVIRTALETRAHHAMGHLDTAD